MSLGTDGEERLPTGSLFDAKENGGADFQCRAVDHRYPARTQAGRPFTLRVVRESFNSRVIGLMTHTTGTAAAASGFALHPCGLPYAAGRGGEFGEPRR